MIVESYGYDGAIRLRCQDCNHQVEFGFALLTADVLESMSRAHECEMTPAEVQHQFPAGIPGPPGPPGLDGDCKCAVKVDVLENQVKRLTKVILG